MPYDVRTLAARKHQETQQSEIEWMKAFESARLSLKFIEIDLQSLELIALASRSASQFTVMTRLIYQYGKSHPHGELISDLLFQFTNESPFSLSDWMDAIEFFYNWLIQTHRKIDFLPMLKYLECCIASPEARESGQSFPALVEDMLKVFGYDG